MISHTKIDNFIAKYEETLEKISIDSDAEETTSVREKYVTHSQIKACSFDEVAKKYGAELKISTPKSVDALCRFTEVYSFIEFKNGKIDKKKAFSVAQKVYDSILILDYFTECGTKYMRDHIEFILVYNENISGNSDEDFKKISVFNTGTEGEAPSKYIKKTLAQLANKEFVFFGFNFFKKYCFKDVHTFNKKEFEDYLIKNQK